MKHRLPRIVLRLGTRGSTLARMQSQIVANQVEQANPGLQVEIKIIRTSGDRITDQPLHAFGGKGLFTKELEEALIGKEVDFVVHSYKDVPVTMPLVNQAGLTIAATPKREDPRDVLVSSTGASSIAALPHGARVGTGSLRRRCQILVERSDLQVQMIRGNIDTRLRKQAEGALDAVVLALAGVKRAGLYRDDMRPLLVDEMLPAAAQGALALQCRADDATTLAALRPLNDSDTQLCVKLERELVARLNGDCHSPIAALAEIADGFVNFRAAVGKSGGEPPVIRACASSPRTIAERALDVVWHELVEEGVQQLLKAESAHAAPVG